MAKKEPETEVKSDEIIVATKPEEETPKAEEPKETPPQEDSPESAPEQPEEETPEEELKEEPSEEEEGEEQAPPQMSRRRAKRLEQAQGNLAKLENLVSKLKGDEAPVQVPKPQGIDYKEVLNADDDTIAQFEADRLATAEASFNQGREQSKSIQFHTRLEIDAPKVESKYSIFDKDSPDFKPETADAINRWYLTSVGYNPQNDTVANPNLRYSDFVEGIMELSDSVGNVKLETSRKNIASQAANTGLRPDGSTTKLNLNKSATEMTDDELKAKMKQITRSLQK
jgi:hypothetical protein